MVELKRVFVWPALVAAACLSAAAVRAADLPYRGYINSPDVHVRSGPGMNYYPTMRIERGEAVDVYRHDPGGWYAVRPPEGSFSWVAAEFVERGSGRAGTIIGQEVAARVGSTFSDIRDVIQIRMDEGERVEILGTVRVGTGQDAKTWYKIAPPAGEFRWVSGKFIDHESSRSVARRNRAGERFEEDRSGWRTHERDDRDEPRDEPSTARNEGDDEPLRPIPEDFAARDREDPTQQPTLADPPAARETAPKESPRGDEKLLDDLDAIEMELSTIVAEDIERWDFRDLRTRTERLVDRSPSSLDRGRVRLVQRKITRFEDIKSRHESLASSRAGGESRGRDAAQSEVAPSSGLRDANDDRYDGVGRLAQINTAETGIASYALLDKQGQVSHYVTPAPGVNLRQYLGREVGIQGSLGYMHDARTQHVTAKRITVLESRLLR